MKGLILAALAGFVLAITLALPYTEDEAVAYNNALGEIRNDITQRYGALMLTLAGDRKKTSKEKKIKKRWLTLRTDPHLFPLLRIFTSLKTRHSFQSS